MLIIEEHRDGLIVQAHKDAAAEKAGRAEDKLERKGFGNQSMAAGASNVPDPLAVSVPAQRF